MTPYVENPAFLEDLEDFCVFLDVLRFLDSLCFFVFFCVRNCFFVFFCVRNCFFSRFFRELPFDETIFSLFRRKRDIFRMPCVFYGCVFEGF